MDYSQYNWLLEIFGFSGMGPWSCFIYRIGVLGTDKPLFYDIESTFCAIAVYSLSTVRTFFCRLLTDTSLRPWFGCASIFLNVRYVNKKLFHLLKLNVIKYDIGNIRFCYNGKIYDFATAVKYMILLQYGLYFRLWCITFSIAFLHCSISQLTFFYV